MKFMRKRILCLAVMLCLLASLAPMTALATGEMIPMVSAPAAEGVADASRVEAVIGDAAQSIGDDGAQVAEDLGPGDLIEGDLYPSYFLGKDSCIQELYEALRLRKNEIYLYYCTSEVLTEADLDELFVTAAQYGFDADGGDYLLCSVADYGYYSEVIQNGGLNYYIIGYAVAYFTTLEQEQALSAKIEELRESIIGDAVNEYQKIKAIHDYIVQNVEVDLENAENVEDLSVHSAYAALMNGKATAQAYPMLFHRMAKQYGIGSRIIIGTVQGEVFMWNIVRCNDVWYNVNIIANDMDSTDAYFMKGSTDFPDGHQPADMYLTEEFKNSHPMSETALNPEKELSGKAGENVEWYYNAVTNEIHVVGSGRMDDEVQIPNIYGGNPALVVEEGITYIGKNAFNSKSISTVQLPDSLTEIGAYAFANGNLESVSGGKNLSVIGEGAFAHCYNLKDYVIPASVTEIGTVAFNNVPMKQANISDKVTKIGANAFENDLFEGYVVDEKNPNFSSENGVLYNKDKTVLLATPKVMNAEFSMPESVTKIASAAFMNRAWMTGIKLHEGITEIGENAFRNSGLYVVQIPSTMTEIPAGAFAVWMLQSVTIPESVTSIGENAFEGCNMIYDVHYGGSKAQWDKISVVNGNDGLNHAEFHENSNKISGYEWTLDLTTGAFTAEYLSGGVPWSMWMDEIVSVELRANATNLPKNAFKDAVNLKTLGIYTNYSHYEEGAFAGCTGLTDIYYNESESKWKEEGIDKAFPDSPNMTVHYKAQPVSGSCGDNAKWTYDEASGVLVISGQGALYGRDNRTWEHWSSYVRVIIVEEGITDLGDQAFYGCTKLVRLVLPEGVTTIGQYAFHGTSLNDITLPVSLQSVHAEVLVSGGPNTDIHYKGTEAQWNAIEFGENNDGFTGANIHFNTTCDHDMVIEYAKTPTCLEEGNTMGKHCTVCNQVFAEKRTLPKAAHAFEFDHSDFSGYKCFRCGTDLDESVPTSGEFGNGLTWSYSFKNGNVMFSYNELTISGQGEMPDFADPSETPWSMFTTDIERVVLTDGVDSVGNRAFEGCANVKNVLFSDVVSIGDHAFDGCVNLNNMTIESPVKNIGDSAFRGCDGLVEVVYYGSEKEWKNVEVGSGNEALLNAGFIFANPVDYVPNPFTDVAKSDWFANPVLWAFDTGVTGGTSADTFGPNNFCTRAQVVTFLYAAAGKPEVTTTENPFEDVADDAWYAKPVLWAVENGITSGIDATHFGPDVTCTRAQVVTFLYAAAGKPEITASSTFTDVADTDWYAKSVIWAKENDVTGGISATEFGPNQTCTRAQVVTFLYKVYAN